jgi:RNA-directed DNA polymerase
MENRQNYGSAVHTEDARRAGMTEKTVLRKDNEALVAAWVWLRALRKTAPADGDIWDLRFHWKTIRNDFLQQLQTGEYRLSPMRVTGREKRMMLTAKDALALKWLALRLQGQLPLHEKCEYVKGHGGGKSSVVRLSSAVQTGEYLWVCRTYIRGYYGAMDKARLLSQLVEHITRPAYLSLLEQYPYYSTEDGGEFHTPEKGIFRGCVLGPLMYPLHLWEGGDYFSQQKNIRYARYMDDFVILAKSRWSLHRQFKALNRRLSDFGFVKHPDKTFIGPVHRCFDWLGSWLTDLGVTGIAPRALKNYHEKVRRVYERVSHWQEKNRSQRVSEHHHRWKLWATIGSILGVVSSLLTTPLTVHAATYTATVSPGHDSGINIPFYFTDNDGLAPDQPVSRWINRLKVSPYYSIYGTSSDGVASGIVLAPDVILYVQGAAVLGPTNNRSTVTWIYGKPSGWPAGECGAQGTWGATLCGSALTLAKPSFINNFSLGVYVGPLAAQASGLSYTLQSGDYMDFKWGSGTSAGRWRLSTSNTVTLNILKSMSCSVDMNQQISFGTINTNETDDALLAIADGGLKINCTGLAGQDTDVNISFTGDTLGNTKQLLMRHNVSSNGLAYIQGRMSSPLNGTCDLFASSDVQFDGTVSGTKASVPPGQTIVPLTWSLCRIPGVTPLGEGSAQATVTIDWI